MPFGLSYLFKFYQFCFSHVHYNKKSKYFKNTLLCLFIMYYQLLYIINCVLFIMSPLYYVYISNWVSEHPPTYSTLLPSKVLNELTV